MKPQIIRVPITRLDAENRMVYGYASTGAVDTFGTIIDPAWWPQAVTAYKEKRNLSEMHLDLNGDPIKETHREPMTVGRVPIMEIDDRGLWIGAEITNAETFERIASGDYNGFSVSVLPFEYRKEGQVIRFTKYALVDITVGYPASNTEARFQLIERLAYDDSAPWDWDWGADADAIVAQLGWKGLAQACLFTDSEGEPETKAAYKLPVAKLKAGELTVYWNGCRAAMASLNGARGGIDIPDAARTAAYGKLKKLYKHFGKEIPELQSRLDDGGNQMGKFYDTVAGLVQRLTGKAPDDATKQEITKLETELATDQAKQIATLETTVAGLTDRLQKLENPPKKDDPPKPDETAKKIEDLTATAKTLQERLDAAEKALAKSQQPGENGSDGKGGGDKKNIFEGVIFD
jgi:predicted  nucleic acid-binding Zn-ribbon protein